MTKSTFSRITTKDLKWHPFKIHVVHEMQAGDYARRVQFCRWFSARAHNVRFLSNIIIGDEAIFCMNGSVTTQNVRCYAPKGNQPEFKFEKKNQNRAKLHVWVGLCGNGEIIGPYFFNRNVNSEIYGEMLRNFAFPCVARAFNRYGQIFDGLWWFQDGAPCHRSRAVRELLSQRFENRVIALNEEFEWPPRSPDLTPCDFFLWGFLKQRVFATEVPNLPTLRWRIVNEINRLRDNQNFIRSSFREMAARTNICIEKNGGHVENV